MYQITPAANRRKTARRRRIKSELGRVEPSHFWTAHQHPNTHIAPNNPTNKKVAQLWRFW
jgi:hypothetical protein